MNQPTDSNQSGDTQDQAQADEQAQQAINKAGHIDPALLAYADDTQAAFLLKAPRRARVLLWVVVIFMVTAGGWAWQAPLEQVTRGHGKVIPSSQRQVVQNLEGGIVKAILIREGDTVQANQPLMQIDDTRFRSDAQERGQDLAGLTADALRLQALLQSVTTQKMSPQTLARAWQTSVTVRPAALVFPDTFPDQHSALVQRQQDEFRDSLASLDNQLSVIGQQIQQKARELDQTKARLSNQRHSYALANEEYTITKPLADEGVVPRVELLKLKRQVNDARRDVTASKMQIPALQAAIQEAIYKRLDIALNFRAETQAELNETADKLDALRQTHIGLQDKVSRTVVTSPVNGTVQKLHINTIGGVIQPGMDLIDIVPSEDALIVEAKIAPKDIGFLRPGLKAIVKFTAYDFTQYGGLPGTLEHISADTSVDEEGNSFYHVRIRTDQPHFTDANGNPLPIIPGMTASADVITGHQTVLQYLLNPVLRVRQTALRE
ncbi:HlyD family type I secretion periplasmic adaptor subunit [Photobacterium japonica]|uniref:HlyD family type I secretion periplasmic adaptor subunit n=1 Tax=Photobacterium japonica TaxID=2910235 RepID=UPI003D1287D9